MNKHVDKGPNSSNRDVPENIGNPEMNWCSDVIAQVIRDLNIPYVALVPGASFRGLHDSIVNYLGNQTPRMIVCLHEEHAIAIAEGYARVTETPMAAIVHSNVGLMHATMPIFNAWCDRTPVIVFGATGPVDAHKRRPWIDWVHTTRDQASMIRNFVKWDDQPASVEAAVESILRANQIARTPPYGPVYICLDVELQEAELSDPISLPDVARFAPPALPRAPAEALDEILESVRTAAFPILLMGRVSRSQEEWNSRVELAERLGAVVMSSLHNSAAFPTEHALHILPPSAERPSDEEKALVKKADVIISFDWLDLSGFLRTCFGAAQTQTPAPAKIIQCSLDSYLANGWSMDHQAMAPADINLLARPDDLVRQLLARLDETGAAAPLATPEQQRKLVHWTQRQREIRPGTADALSLDQLAQAVTAFGAGREVTLARTPIGWPSASCRFQGPASYMGKDGGGAVGTGPGHTIGTALALMESGRTVIGVIGDGDYLMGVSALWTASRMRIPVMFVVANNRSYYNDERHQEQVAIRRGRPVQNKWIGQRLDDPAPDLLKLAQSQGFQGEGPIDSVEALEQALIRGEQVLSAGGRYFIDVRVIGY